MSAGLNRPQLVEDLRLTHGLLFEDFNHHVTADVWSSVLTDSGTMLVGDAVGGRVSLVPSDCTVADNDEAYLKTTKEIFLFAANKPLEWGARMQFTEANTDDANVWVGLMDAIAANSLVDNGAGPKTSGSHFGFHKVDGGTQWIAHRSLGATQTSTTLSAANSNDKVSHTAGGASFAEFYGEFIPYSSTAAILNYYINDSTTGGVKRLVYQDPVFTYTSATEMNFGFGLKNGNTNLETLVVDWAFCIQKR